MISLLKNRAILKNYYSSPTNKILPCFMLIHRSECMLIFYFSGIAISRFHLLVADIFDPELYFHFENKI